MKLTIGARLLISFGLLVGFAAIIALYSIESAENAMLRLVGDKTTMVAEDAMARINHDLHIRIAELRKEVEREMADKIQRESGASAAMDAKGPQNGRNALDDFISHYTITFGYPVFTGVALLDKSGETIAAAGSGSLLRLDQAVRRRLMMNHAVYIGRPRVDPGADILAAPVAIPVFSRTGEVVGAAHALVALKALTDSVQLLIKKFETSRSYLFTGRGELIYSTTPFRFLEDMSRSKAYLAVASRGGAGITSSTGLPARITSLHPREIWRAAKV
ncbi:MAG: hypothetical protein GY859_38870 [Desulfobacterales bacterium]|nr:hypothetical protein [Desulfobacterales bacterium]